MEPTELLLIRKYRPEYTPPAQQTILSIREKVIGCLQSLTVFSGIPKSGKSTYMAGTIASAFTPYSIFECKINFPKGRERLALFDTESSEFDFYKQMAHVKNFAQISSIPSNLDAFATREDDPEKIKGMIESYLKQNRDCSVLVIDGLLDLLFDFNNVEESKQLINWIKRITKQFDLLIISVLHLGKGGEKNTLGHLGSMADRLVQSSVKIERNRERNTFDMTPSFLRSSGDFEPISIACINDVWQQVDSPMPDNKSPSASWKSYTELQHSFLRTQALKQSGSPYKEICAAIQESEAVGINAAKAILKKWIAEKSILKGPDGLYHPK